MDFSTSMESGLLETIGKEFSRGSMDLNMLLNNVFNIIASYYRIERGTINIHYREGEEISAAIHYGYTKEEIESGISTPVEDITGTGLQRGTQLVIQDIRNEMRMMKRPGVVRNYSNRVSYIYMPILIEKSVIGAISVELVNNTGRDLVEECHMLTTISIMIAQAVSSRVEMMSREKRLMLENEELRRRSGTLALDEVTTWEGLPGNEGEPAAAKTGSLEERTEQFEREIIIESMRASKGNISRAAKSLGTTKRILGYKISKLGIDYRNFREK